MEKVACRPGPDGVPEQAHFQEHPLLAPHDRAHFFPLSFLPCFLLLSVQQQTVCLVQLHGYTRNK